MTTERARGYSPPTRNDNSVVEYLREHGPATRDEMPIRPPGAENNARRVVGRFNPGYLSNLTSKSRGQPQTVYYLYGDERRAVRKFIDVNTEYVASCMADNHDPMADNLEPAMWQIVVEEWEWGDWEVGEE